MSSYDAYVLTESARVRLLQAFAPKFPDVIAHHVTQTYGRPELDEDQYGTSHVITVRGYVCDESLEAVVVSVDGVRQRPDGKLYHITLSLDRSKGRKPVESNQLIAAGPIQETPRVQLMSVFQRC